MSRSHEITDHPADLLARSFASNKAAATVLMGLGNPLCGDDGLGCEAARLVTASGSLHVLICDEMPENYTADVKRLKPERIFLIDAVDFSGSPGDLLCLTGAELQSDRFNTHKPSLGLLMRYLEAETGAEVVLIGMQPKIRALHAPLSPEVQESIGHLAALLADLAHPFEKEIA